MSTPTIEEMQAAIKSRQVKIPISRRVDILYKPTGTRLCALVASSEFTEQPEGTVIYVEGGSQHGMLSLWEIPKEPVSHLPERVDTEGGYDRDPTTRKITAIYLHERTVLSASYKGTLDDLMQNPTILRR